MLEFATTATRFVLGAIFSVVIAVLFILFSPFLLLDFPRKRRNPQPKLNRTRSDTP